MRPSSEQVLRGIREGNLDPLPPSAAHLAAGHGTLVPRGRATSPLASRIPVVENGFHSTEAEVYDASSDDDGDLLTSSRNLIFRGEDDDETSSVDSSHLPIPHEKWEHAPSSPLRESPLTSPTTRARARSKSGPDATFNGPSASHSLPRSFEEVQVPLLALPSPPLPLPATPRPMPAIAYAALTLMLRIWSYPWPWTRTATYTLVRAYVADWLARNRFAVVKGLKSGLLVAKVRVQRELFALLIY